MKDIEQQRKDLRRSVTKFIRGRRMSGGGLSPVAHGDMTGLADIISRLITLKWQADPDGDLPVEYHLIDRTRFERPLHPTLVPYAYKRRNHRLSREEEDRLIRSLAQDAGAVIERIEKFAESRDYDAQLRRKDRRNQKLRTHRSNGTPRGGA